MKIKFRKFLSFPLERKILILFLSACVVFPFLTIESPTELFSHVGHFWANMYTAIPYWINSGKPFWETSLVCFCITSVGLVGLYAGGFSIRKLFLLIFNKARDWLRIQRNIPIKNQLLVVQVVPRFNNYTKERKRMLSELLSKQSAWLILFLVCLPIPFFDVIGGVALGIKKTKYAVWLLLLANAINTILLMLAYQLGFNFFQYRAELIGVLFLRQKSNY
jgi:hypothetical protein